MVKIQKYTPNHEYAFSILQCRLLLLSLIVYQTNNQNITLFLIKLKPKFFLVCCKQSVKVKNPDYVIILLIISILISILKFTKSLLHLFNKKYFFNKQKLKLDSNSFDLVFY